MTKPKPGKRMFMPERQKIINGTSKISVVINSARSILNIIFPFNKNSHFALYHLLNNLIRSSA